MTRFGFWLITVSVMLAWSNIIAHGLFGTPANLPASLLSIVLAVTGVLTVRKS